MKKGLPLLAETDHWVALNKPAGLLSVPDREGKEESLKSLLQKQYGKIWPVHRLDRDTSGVILFAKNEEAHRYLSMQFEQRDVRKRYGGLVIGKPLPLEGSITSPIKEHHAIVGKMTTHRNGKSSQTNYIVAEQFAPYSWVLFEPITGRTHQIRVHMQSIGFPLVCDNLYGDAQPLYLSRLKPGYKISKHQEEETPLLNRLALHAMELSFPDLTGEKIKIQAELPKELQVTLLQLRKYSRQTSPRFR
ncbi:MAG: RluA family pseudouridine synthase [Bacteroidetes bacterium]|nr:RluA family pseudouridine synthase [Bacteroidota bacterium]